MRSEKKTLKNKQPSKHTTTKHKQRQPREESKLICPFAAAAQPQSQKVYGRSKTVSKNAVTSTADHRTQLHLFILY